MKTFQSVRLLLASLLLVLTAAAATALPVSEASARRVTQNLFRQHIALHGNWGGSLAPAIVAVTPVDLGGERLAFNVTVAPSGHVLVGGDDELSAVLLYSDVSAFDPSKASDPESLEGWIVPEVASHVARLKALPGGREAGTRPAGWESTRTGQGWRRFDVPEEEFRPRSRRSLSEATVAGTVGDSPASAGTAVAAGPLLTTAWTQESPYNAYMPADTGCARTVAGCVTIATVQVMRYWRWPAAGTGSHSYLWPSHTTLSADFNHTYDWSLMPDTLSSGSPAAQIDAVARLISDVAIANEMNFGCDGSAAYSSYSAFTVLPTYFGYQMPKSASRSRYSDPTQFFGLIRADIDAAPPRPVLLSVFTTDGTAGHFIVVDGYDTTSGQMAHLNLGWGGYYQGYYNINSDWAAGGYIWSANSQVIYTGVVPNLRTTVSSTGPTGAIVSATVPPSVSPVSVVFEYGLTTSYGMSTPAQVVQPNTSVVSANATLTGLTCGSVYHFRVVETNAAGTMTSPDNTLSTTACQVVPTVAAISAGGAHTCALTTAGGIGGGVVCWGDNSNGQLGDGTTTDRVVPTPVSGLGFGAAAVKAGSYHTCALTTGGGVVCWGYNNYGQIGDGTTTQRPTPTPVSGLNAGVLALSAGGYHSCVLTAGGGVTCWGRNDSGQIGDGTSATRRPPTPVTGLASGVAVLAAGGWHSCALTTSGGVVCWGDNENGQLGDGTTTTRLTPTPVIGLQSGVAAVAAGTYSTCALTAGGGVVCWGDNSFGQLGDGTVTRRSTPTAVIGLASGVAVLAAGDYHTCALTTTGGVVCWGHNDSGQLGDGTTTTRHTAAAASGLSSGVVSIVAGWSHTCALTTGRAVVCWGANSDGEFGDGTTTSRSTPTPASGQGQWVVQPTLTQITPAFGPAAGGTVVTLTGTGFAAGTTVAFGGIAATSVSVTSATQMVATAPAHASGTVSVVVTNADGGQVAVAGGFLYRTTVAAVDLGGAGKSDAVVFRGAAGQWWIHGQSSPATFGQSGDIPVVADYDGNGKAELAVYRPSTSEWVIKDQRTVVFGKAGDVPVPGDYNGDGKAEIAVFRPSTGEWIIEGQGTPTVWGARGDVPVPGDYNGDGVVELAVFRPTTGVWYVQGGETLEWGMWGDVPVAGDYNGDGKAEIAVYRPSTGWWYVARGAMAQWGMPGDVPVPLDLNGDGVTEFVVFRPSQGAWYALNPATSATTTYAWGQAGDDPVGTPPHLPATPVRTTAGDFDHDGSADITVFRPSDGGWYTLQSTHAYHTYVGVTLGQDGDIPVPGDYQGTGHQERAVYRPSTGQWLLEDGRTFTLGAPDDVPVPGDYDGDGIMDIAIFTPSTGLWSILTGASGFTTLVTELWGVPGDVPAPGDYDGDGKADLAVFTPATGQWSIRSSLTGTTLVTVPFGMSGDTAVPGDYDGDGKTDIAVYRPSTGYWYVLTSSSTWSNYQWYWWGAVDDVPVPGDFDGDGVTDVAVYRPSTGTWYVMDVMTIVGWGETGDVPVLGRK